MSNERTWSASQEAVYNEEAVTGVLRTFSFLTPPIRPSAAAQREFRRHFEKTAGRPALVLGATPELVDILNDLGSPVTCLDWSADIFEAMRRLARTDWSRVRFRHGDWRSVVPDFANSFGCMASDGGPLFLHFPEEWRAVSSAAHGYLLPGGRWITRGIDWPRSEVPFEAWARQRIREFEARRVTMTAEQQLAGFKQLTMEIRTRTVHGLTAETGALDEVEFLRRNDEGARILYDLYPDPTLREIAEMNLALLARPAPGKTHVVSAASPSVARAALTGLDFDFEVTELKLGDLCCDYVLAAVKR